MKKSCHIVKMKRCILLQLSSLSDLDFLKFLVILQFLENGHPRTSLSSEPSLYQNFFRKKLQSLKISFLYQQIIMQGNVWVVEYTVQLKMTFSTLFSFAGWDGQWELWPWCCVHLVCSVRSGAQILLMQYILVVPVSSWGQNRQYPVVCFTFLYYEYRLCPNQPPGQICSDFARFQLYGMDLSCKGGSVLLNSKMGHNQINIFLEHIKCKQPNFPKANTCSF